MNMNERVHVITHPMIQHKLTLLRDKETGVKEFRECLKEMSALLCYEATKDLVVKKVEVESPLGTAEGYTIDGKSIALVPILRGGIVMADGILEMIPVAVVGFIGVYRDPISLRSVQYYCKMPSDINEREALILAPVVATGANATSAIETLKNYKCRGIKLMCAVISEQAVKELTAKFPDVEIFCAAIDSTVDENGYLIPGIGDAGDREYGTK